MSHRDDTPVRKKKAREWSERKERESKKKKKIERFCGHTRREKQMAPQPASQPTETDEAAAGCDAMH
jgi:hypothetical protein